MKRGIGLDLKYSLIKGGVTKKDISDISKKQAIKNIQKEILDIHKLRNEKGQGFSHDLGVINSPYDEELIKSIKETLSDIKKLKIDVKHVILAGIGGSELGATALYQACGKKEINYYPITSLNNDNISEILERIIPKETILIGVSRSGTTKETLTSYLIVKEFLKERLGEEHIDHCVAVLGKDKTGLAKEWGTHTKVQIEGAMSGRFTALHAANLFTMAILGINIDEVQKGARDMIGLCLELNQKNQALTVAALKYNMLKKGKKVLITSVFSPKLVKYGDWLDQLTEESLGHRTNISISTKTTELSNKLHSDFQNWLEGDNIFYHQFVFPKTSKHKIINNPLVRGENLEMIEKAAYLGTAQALAKANRPSFTTFIDKIDEYSMGQLLARDIIATIYLGELFNLGKVKGIKGKGYFNQPGVQAYKTIMKELLKDPKKLSKI